MWAQTIRKEFEKKISQPIKDIDPKETNLLLLKEENKTEPLQATFSIRNNSKEMKMKMNFLEEGIVKLSSENPLNTAHYTVDDVEKIDISPLDPKLVALEKSDVLITIPSHNQTFRVNFSSSGQFSFFDNENLLVSLNRAFFLSNSPNPRIDILFETEFVYGFPERADRVLLQDTEKDLPYCMWATDRYMYNVPSKAGLYGAVPFIIGHSPKGTVGVFWRNTSQTYLSVDKKSKNLATACGFYSEVGDLEMYIIMDVNIQDFFRKVANLLGKTPLPPYFSLGYQQSRYSFQNQKDVETVDENFDKNEIPYDVLWLDIDHTDNCKYYTFNMKDYPDPASMVKKITEKGRKFV